MIIQRLFKEKLRKIFNANRFFEFSVNHVLVFRGICVQYQSEIVFDLPKQTPDCNNTTVVSIQSMNAAAASALAQPLTDFPPTSWHINHVALFENQFDEGVKRRNPMRTHIKCLFFKYDLFKLKIGYFEICMGGNFYTCLMYF